MTHARTSRRRFLMGAVATASLAGVDAPLARAAGDPGPRTIEAVTRTIEVKGKAATVYGLVGPDGKRPADFVAGDSFYVRLANKLAEPTLVHWHGITPPSHQDGVPVLAQDPIGPGNSFLYDFRLTEPGTYWMHSHFSLTQMQRLLLAPLVVLDPAERRLDEQQVVVMLNDFTFRDPEEILRGLRKETSAAASSSGMAGMGGIAAMPGMGGMKGMPGMAPGPMAGMADVGGGASTAASGAGGMAGMAMDVNDIDFDAYLANDRTLDDPEVVRVDGGGRVRLRIIAGTASTNFHLDLAQLQGQLVAVDGMPVVPITAGSFPLAMAQRIDLRLTLPAGDGAYPILAQRVGDMQRTGVILATKGASVRRIADQAAAKSAVVGLDLERRLKALRPLAQRRVDRTHPVVLGGDMAKYVWTMNGAVYGQDKPLGVALGERVELVMRNETGMSHPMHLHGVSFQVVAIDGVRFAGAVRDTVLVPPKSTVTVAFDAENAGRWAFHCHNSYHQEAGMMTSVEYA